MSYVYTNSTTFIRGKEVPVKSFESYTMDNVIDFTVEETASGRFVKSVYNIQTQSGNIRVEEKSKRNIMRKCLESGGKITFIVWGNGIPSNFTLDPIVRRGGGIIHSDRDPTTLAWVSFKSQGMVENTKDVHWGRVWAFVDGVQIV